MRVGSLRRTSFCLLTHERWHRTQFLGRWSILRVDLQAVTYSILEIMRVMLRDWRKFPLGDLLVKLIHIFGKEWWLQRCKLVNHTTQRPDVAFGGIGLIGPNLRRTVVGSSSLSLHDSVFGDLRNIHISKLYTSVGAQKYICTFYISMNNPVGMKCAQSLDELPENIPNFLLFHKRL